MDQLFGKKRVAIRIAIRGDALGERRRLVFHGRRLDEDSQSRRGPGTRSEVEPACRHRRHRRREDGALGFRRRAADPLREQPPRLLGLLGGRERGKGDFFDPLLGALRVGVEEAQGLDSIAIQLHAHGEVAVRRKDVEEPAPHGEIAGLDDEVPAPVAQARQPLGEPGERHLIAAPDPDEELAKSARDREAA